jgi:bifunctional DNase/RNase
MELISLKVKGISYSETQSGAYALILSEKDGNRKLPIIIGGFEAQSIAIAIEDEIKPSRPLTHDLFKNFADRFNVNIKKVIIHKLLDGVFYSSIICERDKIEEIIDSRTSDAIALALRFKAPILTYDSILEKAGFTTSISSNKNFKTSNDNWNLEIFSQNINKNLIPKDLNKMKTSELKSFLNKMVSKENYEQAAKLRDELLKRKSKK